jgi:hypothetical protein
MSVRAWLRGNLFLVAGVVLPVAVVLFFLLATAVPRWLVAPPAYDLLFAGSRAYQRDGERLWMAFRVRDGHLEAQVRDLKEHESPRAPRLYRFDHGTGGVREIPVELPAGLVLGPEVQTFVVTALAGQRISTERRAPDGYLLRHRDRSGGGLFGELFGMHRSGAPYVIAKDGRVMAIPAPDAGRYYYQIDFLGWIIDEHG